MMTNANRKALSTAIREAADSLGWSVAVVTDPTGQGRLMYSLAGSKALTPGQAAHILCMEGF